MTKGSTFTGLKIVLCFFVYSEISFFYWTSIYLIFTSLSLRTGVSSTDWVCKALSDNKIDVLEGKSEHTTSSLNTPQAKYRCFGRQV